MVIFDTKPHKKIAHLKIKQTQHAILTNNNINKHESETCHYMSLK